MTNGLRGLFMGGVPDRFVAKAGTLPSPGTLAPSALDFLLLPPRTSLVTTRLCGSAPLRAGNGSVMVDEQGR